MTALGAMSKLFPGTEVPHLTHAEIMNKPYLQAY